MIGTPRVSAVTSEQLAKHRRNDEGPGDAHPRIVFGIKEPEQLPRLSEF